MNSMVCDKTTGRAISIHRRGFTLVELMVAMVLVSLLTTLIYGLFIRTSDAMSEVDSLADTVNKTRFALEHVRYDLASAGAQASPDSDIDPNVRPRNEAIRVMGVVPYTGWQNATPTEIATENPQASFDGIIVMGAFDFPQTILVGDVSDTGVSIANDGRGVQRLVANNPFFLGDAGLDEGQLDDIAEMLDGTSRLLRISDRQGFHQYLPISAAARDGNAISMGFATDVELQFRAGGEMYGIEATGDPGDRYEAALIDAFWYHVVPVPGERGNYALVRERLDVGELVSALGGSNGYLSGPPPEAMLAGEQRVITDRVVDFQVWFDCATGSAALGGGGIGIGDWIDTWNPPEESCVATAAGANSASARVAHIRLSLRTENERANRLHMTVAGAGWDGFETEDGQMQTFDVIPEAPGAATVVTMQTSVEMSNFALRGL
jgi:prepilin-type N-terminal cleavage/methylation domain-containing protein